MPKWRGGCANFWHTVVRSRPVKELAALLVESRTRCGFSVRGLASEAGVPLKLVRELEAGNRRSLPEPEPTQRLARTLDLSMADVFRAAGYIRK